MKAAKRLFPKDFVKQGWRFLGLTALAVLCILGSLYGMNQAVDRYRTSTLAEYDKQLMVTAKVVERNASLVINEYLDTLARIVEDDTLVQAEADWRASGETSALQHCMKNSAAAQAQHITALLLMQDGEVAVSSNGNRNYTFCRNKGTSEEVRLMHDQTDDTHYVAFLHPRGKLTYIMVVRAEECYMEIEGTGLVDTENDLCLMDASGTLLVHTEAGQIQVETMQDGAAERGTVREMMLCQHLGEPRIINYEARDERGLPFEARTAALPASELTRNFLLVGIRSNFDQMRLPQIGMAFQLLFGGIVLIFGIGLLLVLSLYSDSRKRKAQQEIEILNQRNAEMEQINSRMMDIAHHQRLELIGTMTSGVAHEFNNLLTPIMGYSLMVMERLPPEDEESYDNMLAIYDASRKAKNIIARLGSLSRKNNAIVMQYVSPDELVRRTLEVAKPNRPKNVQLITDLNCEGKWIYGGETGLAQMLLNLVLNSYHALKEMGGVLTVATEASEKMIRFHVSDNGPGIPDELKDKIFQPFYTTKGNEGTGLGLAIVQQVVSENNGEIRLHSEAGQGTEFVISLPQVEYKGPDMD